MSNISNYINLMSSQICYYEKIEISKINIGKSQYFNNEIYMCPIYYNNNGK